MKWVKFMKKWLCIISALLCITLTACENTGDIGIIGGADGPTSIIAAKKKANKQYRSEKEPVKAIMLNGYIYYETGEDRDVTAKCGTLDGNFTKAVDQWELPKKDNEANFALKSKEYCGYQWGITEATIEVPIGDDWEIFKKLDDPEKDLTQYQYILKVEGDTQYKHGKSEYIILSNTLDVTANDVAKSNFSSDSNDHMDIYIVAADLD